MGIWDLFFYCKRKKWKLIIIKFPDCDILREELILLKVAMTPAEMRPNELIQ